MIPMIIKMESHIFQCTKVEIYGIVVNKLGFHFYM